jgi:zinc protease
MRFHAGVAAAGAALLGVACATVTGPKEAAPAKPVADAIFSLPYLMRDLPNGLRVIVVRTAYPDLVTLQIPVQTGSRNEVEPGKSGFAHFFEHMMFRGTPSVPEDEFTRILKAAGADNNAYTSDDLTNYHTTFSKEDLETIIALEADRFQNLTYTEEQFRTEALAVKGEYLKNYADPGQKLFETVRSMAFTEHTYRHTTMGFLKDIEDMPNQLEYSRVFFERWYRPEKTSVIVVGDVDPEATFRLVQKYWGPWKRGSYDVNIPQEPPPQGPAYRHISWESPTQPQVWFAFRGPAFNPDDKALAALQLLGEIHFSDTSDLYQRVVNQERWADALFYWFPERKDPNLLFIGARINKPEDAHKVADAIMETVVRARTEKVPADKLADIRSYIKYGFAAGLDSSSRIGAMLARFVHFERTPETVNRYYRSFDHLTADDLLDQANRYFTDAGRFVVSVSSSPALAGLETLPPLEARILALRDRTVRELGTVLLPSDSPLVDVSFLFHAGPALDPPGKKGLAMLTAAMVSDGGSATRTIRELKEARFPMAADFRFRVDKEMTRFGGTVHRDNLDRWYRLAMEQLLTPGWREDDFRRLRQQHINAVRTDLRSNNDEELAKEVLYAEIYGPRHPYGSYNMGAIRDLESITLDDVRAFYAKHYTPGNLTLGLAGGYPPAFLEQVQRDLARLPPGVRESWTVPQAPPLKGRRATVVQKDTPSVAVSFGFPVELRRGDPDWIALWLARSWLGEHRSFNGRLMNRIRGVRGMNYGNYAYEEYFPNGMFLTKPEPGYGRQQQIFQIWLRPLRSNNDALFATRAALFEIDQLLRDGIPPDEFEETRRFLEKFVSQLVDTQSRQLGYALDSRYYGIPAFHDYVRAGLKALTLEDVNRVVRRHLQIDNIQFVFVAKDAADLRTRLINSTPSPITYNSPRPQELLEEDRRIEAIPFRLTAQTTRLRKLEDVFR